MARTRARTTDSPAAARAWLGDELYRTLGSPRDDAAYVEELQSYLYALLTMDADLDAASARELCLGCEPPRARPAGVPPPSDPEIRQLVLALPHADTVETTSVAVVDASPATLRFRVVKLERRLEMVYVL